MRRKIRHFPTRNAVLTRRCYRHEGQPIPDAKANSPETAVQIFSDIVVGEGEWFPANEMVVCLLMNAHHRLNNVYVLEGTVDHAMIYPRNIVQAALDSNSVQVIVIHNHPSGEEPDFSSQDDALAIAVYDALKASYLHFNDFIVVTWTEEGLIRYKSKREEGNLPGMHPWR